MDNIFQYLLSIFYLHFNPFPLKLVLHGNKVSDKFYQVIIIFIVPDFKKSLLIKLEKNVFKVNISFLYNNME